MYAPAATQCVNLSFSVYRRMCPGGTTCPEVLTILLLPDGSPPPRGPSGRTANSARRGQSIRQPWLRCRATSAAPSTASPSMGRAGRWAIRRNFRLRGVMQNIDYAGAANALRIVHAGIREIGMLAKLLRASFRKELHIVLAAEVQAARRAGFDAGRFEPFADAIRAQRTLENAMSLRIHLRNVKRASRDAIAAADAVGLLKIDDAIRVLHDGPVRRTRREATGLCAVHALVLAHQPHQRAVFFANVFVEEDQVPVVPARLRHGLVGIVENGFAERQVVPLHAGHFAGFATDAGRSVDEFANGVFALGALAGNGPRVTGDFLDAQYFLAHGILYAFSSFTRKPLNSGVYALGSNTVGVSRFTSVLASLFSSSLMPR